MLMQRRALCVPYLHPGIIYISMVILPFHATRFGHFTRPLRVDSRARFILPVTPEIRAGNPWMAAAPPPPPDPFLDNVLRFGADSLPDVAPGISTDPDDSEYDNAAW